MPSLFESVWLGILQGISEFFPISSSGHLSLLQIIFQLDHILTFTIFAHFGSLLSVICFYRREIKNLFKGITHPLEKNLLLKLITASVPSFITGLLGYQLIKEIFHQPYVVVIGFLFTAIFLLISGYRSFHLSKKQSDLEQISYQQALIVGCFQIIAFIPGVSRSGMSIGGGVCLGISPPIAVTFSFLLGGITLLGACVLEFSKIQWGFHLITPFVMIVITSFLSGYIALHLMKSWSHQFYKFSFYLIPLALIAGIYFYQ